MENLPGMGSFINYISEAKSYQACRGNDKLPLFSNLYYSQPKSGSGQFKGLEDPGCRDYCLSLDFEILLQYTSWLPEPVCSEKVVLCIIFLEIEEPKMQ